ncbi:MAG: sensor histidine kinase [Rhodoferax sp.]|nr:sensor histidine kinase [Rhodoferax sp.]
MIDLMTRALDRVESMRIETAAMVVQRTTLFQELQHRVANNLMTVAIALAVEERRLKHLPEAVESFKRVRLRFEMLSRIHRGLHDPENAAVEFGPYLQTLCDGFLDASERPNIHCIVDSCHVAFDADRTVTLSLLALEIVTNSLKHAFADGESGTICLSLAKSTERSSHLVLTVRDNGRGLQPGFDFTKGGRLGVGILKGFARTLKGEITVSSASPEKGTIVRLSFPCAMPILAETAVAPLSPVTARAALPAV